MALPAVLRVIITIRTLLILLLMQLQQVPCNRTLRVTTAEAIVAGGSEVVPSPVMGGVVSRISTLAIKDRHLEDTTKTQTMGTPMSMR